MGRGRRFAPLVAVFVQARSRERGDVIVLFDVSELAHIALFGQH